MRKSKKGRVEDFILCVLSICIGASICSAQTIKQNSDKPLAKNAGRVLKLQEIWRITDEGGQFYFKYPGQLKIAEDGTIFLVDWEQFLRFSPEGKFLKNLFKKGEGPGEILREFSYHIQKNEIYVKDLNSGRLFRTNLDDNLLDQLKIRGSLYDEFCGVKENSLVLIKSDWPPPGERTGKLMDVLYTVYLVSKDGKNEKSAYTFPVKRFLARGAAMAWAGFESILSDSETKIFVSHTREYLIEVLDLEKSRITLRFSRVYPRVKYNKQGWEDDFRKRTNAPVIEFEEDIKSLFLNKEHLWVRTSTSDKEKGDLFDVFDAKGRFIDSYYLGAGRTLLKAAGKILYILEKDKAENYLLIKFKIME